MTNKIGLELATASFFCAQSTMTVISERNTIFSGTTILENKEVHKLQPVFRQVRQTVGNVLHENLALSLAVTEPSACRLVKAQAQNTE